MGNEPAEAEGLSRPDEELDREVALVELVNRVIDRGVMISGEVLISVAGIDLVQLGVNLYVASAETLEQRGGTRWIGARERE